MFLEQIRDNIKLSSSISKFVKLHKKGKDYFGLCPFHNETSPSFSVNDDKKFYHCFGCGAHGDVISFVQKMEGLGFRDAVQKLAQENGISVPANFDTSSKEEKELLEINAIALEVFNKNLYSNQGSRALEYVDKRGISQSDIKHFGIGYAINSKSHLLEHLKSKGFSINSLKSSGLFTSLENGGLIDKFRDRVIFPIFSKNGAVIAFGGRSISNIEPKYLNSPETIVFHKRQVLYGENWIKPLKNLKEVFVVEGYTDVIALNRAGITNVVATLGTAISPEHLAKLWNMVETPVICMDGDAAGEKAMERVIDLSLPLIKSGSTIKFLQLPAGSDPHDTVINYGAEYTQNLFLKEQIGLSDAIWRSAIKNRNVDTPENQALLDNFLNEKASHVQDYSLKKFYSKFFNEQLTELVRNTQKSKRANKNHTHGSFKHEAPKSLIKKIASLPKIKRFQINLIAIIISKPELLNNDKIFEGISSLEVENANLRQTQSTILEIFTTLQNYGINPQFEELFQTKLKQAVEPAILSYLCGADSYFIDKDCMIALEEAQNTWFRTFELYSLELIRKEYEFYLNQSNNDDKFLEIAMKLRQEIIRIENKLNKTYI